MKLPNETYEAFLALQERLGIFKEADALGRIFEVAMTCLLEHPAQVPDVAHPPV